MAHRAGEPFDSQRLLDQDEVDALFSTANPNPERSGCPPRSTLEELARRARNIDDADYKHLTQCSACYREFREIQHAGKHPLPRVRPAVWAVAAAAVVFLSLGAIWLFGGRQTPPPSNVAAGVVAQKLDVDLRPFTNARSQDGREAPSPIPLPTAQVELALRLETGAEAGQYDVRLVDTSSRAFAETAGDAVIRDYITTLDVSLDLRPLAAGDYRLLVRRAGDDWHAFPVVVR